ncbi:diaminohydroxyphosphoribosylaminopyrimidine deaminase and 5-amino-6-(5-phosphoribosylamino)uracil reductase [Proteus mirabilis]|uniref:Diaminohydroxyphosphoribosylaminopyrimidine deaminase and 5-amino-6-(5-phosphoribosylamino)uracil reductase n=1 Tax=Proteus mirabilis TaxID=584 RepID=A0A379FJG8_PROMI|nr:diaminohydroxyphosphoribosylaminopyrimidine deaminase and 5-amino-6-(5-phosphoribosylamino)uracil reductase [Proteus mirabilis]
MMTINNSNNPTSNEPANDETYMRRAIELAALGRFTTSPNPNVGCVIVKEGKIIGEGYHHHAGGPHAEVNALNMAVKMPKVLPSMLRLSHVATLVKRLLVLML